MERLTNSSYYWRQTSCSRSPYGVAEGDGEAEGFVSFLVESFFVVSVDDFLVVSVEDFLVEDFLVVVVLAGAFFSGAVVVEVSVLLVLQAPRSAATARQVIE